MRHGADRRSLQSDQVRLQIGKKLVECDRKANEVLLTQARDSALRAGVRTRFFLLRDVLDQRAPAASVYLFVNAFHLRTDERTQLQAELARNRAAAIWMYAPGYFDAVPAVANVAETTQIKVKMFDGPAQSGSVSLLPGRWIAKDEEFGTAQEWDPLFYIDDPQTDVLAKYRASKKGSVAIRFFEEGWASIFCAEPALTPALLRDILGILELRVCFQAGPKKFYDTTCFGPNLFAIHAKETGERIVDLDRVYDVQDLLAPEIGWPRKRTFSLSLKTGETRLLRLTPVEVEEAP